MTPVIGRGTFGDLVATLQKGLARLGYYTGGIDGDFGGGSERAVQNLQADKGLRRSGAADARTWTLATGLPWPSLFQRCLQVTARFEGHGYRTIAGNFDGAGLTWGIIGFTLRHGEIQAIVRQVQTQNPSVLSACFGERVDELLSKMNSPLDAQLAWSDSLSAGPNKYTVIEPWRSAFSRFGADDSVREIQRQRAQDRYFQPALQTVRRVQAKSELSSELGIALCFDIHVQNGGVEEIEFAAYRRKLASLGKKATASDKRLALARIVADQARAKYREDVFSRKSTLATGAGLVHGQMFELVNWGLSDKKGKME